MNHKTRHPKGFTPIWLGLITLISLPFISIAMVQWQARGEVYSIQNAPPKQVALVLGAAAYGNTLSDILEDRVNTAIELYKEEKVSQLVMSGGENEASAMKKYALRKGIPEKDVIEDPKGENTFFSIKNLQESEKSLIIVSQDYHLPRALYIAKKLHLEAIGVKPDEEEYIKIEKFKQREWVATSWIVFYLLFLED